MWGIQQWSEAKRTVSFNSHTTSAGGAEVSGHVPLYRWGLLLASWERRAQAANAGPERDHLRASRGAEESQASHKSAGAAGRSYRLSNKVVQKCYSVREEFHHIFLMISYILKRVMRHSNKFLWFLCKHTLDGIQPEFRKCWDAF